VHSCTRLNTDLIQLLLYKKQEFFVKADSSGDDKVSFEEYTVAMKKAPPQLHRFGENRFPSRHIIKRNGSFHIISSLIVKTVSRRLFVTIIGEHLHRLNN